MLTKTILLLARKPRLTLMINTRMNDTGTAKNTAKVSSTPAFIVLGNTGDEAKGTK